MEGDNHTHLVKENIHGFNVSMDNTVVVEVLKSTTKLIKIPQYLLLQIESHYIIIYNI